MKRDEVAVKFEPQGKTVYALKGTRIVEAALRAGASLNMPCGGQGTCGKCRVRVLENPCEPTESERKRLSPQELAAGFRLACQSEICGATTIEIPLSSLIGSSYQILGGATDEVAERIDPAILKRHVELSPPSRGDGTPDVERLQKAVGDFDATLPMVRALPGRLRAWDFRGTAVLADHELIDFEEGDTTASSLAVAFDIGTTTLVGSLLDVVTGREIAGTARLNPQTSYGDDVLSRILHVRENGGGLEELRSGIVAEVNAMIVEMATAARVEKSRIYEVVVAGNTTMQQLFAGLDPFALGEVPFVPVRAHGSLYAAADLGLDIHERGRVYVFPVIGGFVGGDTVSGIAVTGLTGCDGPTILVDIGTNGEIVLCAKDRLVASSTAAGPAFEGARIKFGMRAAAGAIEKVMLDGDVQVNVIGNAAPVGICGSALIDLAAELLRTGLLMREGLLLSADQAPDGTPEALRRRLVGGDKGTDFVIAWADENGGDTEIRLTQQDIRELQLATGAIRAGVSVLLQRAGVDVSEVRRVLVAGGFGNFVRRKNAQRIGLLPPDIPRERVCFVGNAALAGARLAAFSREFRSQAEELARRTEHVDLSLDPAFQMTFMETMVFPESGG